MSCDQFEKPEWAAEIVAASSARSDHSSLAWSPPHSAPVACCAPTVLSPRLDDAAATELAVAFKVLADPVRLRLLSLIGASPDGTACSCDLEEPVGKSQPTVSHHLSLLADAGHMATDAAAVVLALGASYVATLKGGPRSTFGLHRAAAAVGGGFAGFAPAMVSQSNSHWHMTALWLVPAIVWSVVRRIRSERQPIDRQSVGPGPDGRRKTLGVIGFGGPAAHIALMRREVVERRGWLSDQQMVDLVGITNLIPGPNSTEMAMHVGRLRAGGGGSRGVRGVAMAPRLFDTGLTHGSPDEMATGRVGDAAFPKRMGRPEEYGKLAVAIVENPMLNGGCIRLDAGQRQSLLYSSELELGETMVLIYQAIDRVKPQRIVLDSLSEIRLLAQSSLRYRRQILALKHYLAQHNATVVLLDDLTRWGRKVRQFARRPSSGETPAAVPVRE